MSKKPQRKVFLGVSGASGAIYACRTLQMLVAAEVEVALCYTEAAKRVLLEECKIDLKDDPSVLLAPEQNCDLIKLWPNQDIGAPPASGTAIGEAAILLPCSLSTLASVSSGKAQSLVARAAQVALKEGRKLIIVPRETPLNKIHLDQMSRLAWAGACIMPASPGFYHQPQSIEELVDHLCAKVLGVLDIPQSKVSEWGGSS